MSSVKKDIFVPFLIYKLNYKTTDFLYCHFNGKLFCARMECDRKTVKDKIAYKELINGDR